MTTVLGFELVVRFVNPRFTAGFTPEQMQALCVHLCFSVPAAIVLPFMLFSGKTHRSWHVKLAILFSCPVAWHVRDRHFLSSPFDSRNHDTPAEPNSTPSGTGRTCRGQIGNQEWVLDEGDLLNPNGESRNQKQFQRPNADSDQFRESENSEIRNSRWRRRSSNQRCRPPRCKSSRRCCSSAASRLKAEKACAIIRGLSIEQFREAIEVLNRVYRLQNRPYCRDRVGAGYARSRSGRAIARSERRSSAARAKPA